MMPRGRVEFRRHFKSGTDESSVARDASSSSTEMQRPRRESLGVKNNRFQLGWVVPHTCFVGVRCLADELGISNLSARARRAGYVANAFVRQGTWKVLRPQSAFALVS